MICGSRVFDPGTWQHKFCTVPLRPFENTNHDMPGPDGSVKFHQSGEFVWATAYPEIGPEELDEPDAGA